MLINSQEELWPLIACETLKSNFPFGAVPKVAGKHFPRTTGVRPASSLNISSATWENSWEGKILQKAGRWGWIYLHKLVLN